MKTSGMQHDVSNELQLHDLIIGHMLLADSKKLQRMNPLLSHVIKYELALLLSQVKVRFISPWYYVI